jgi:hypothetical protein
MIALNHSFLRGIAHAAPQRALDAFNLVEHVRRRTLELPRVHETLAGFDTGAGSLIQWANRYKGDTSLGPLVELMLRGLSGPFLPEKHLEGPVEPSLDLLDDWLVELIRRLLAASQGTTRGGLLSPSPTGGADVASYQGVNCVISNWRDPSAFDSELIASSGGTTLEVLLEAESQMDGQLIVLPSARRSAAAWNLDCSASELHRALLGLELYAAALRELGSSGERLSREACAARYHERTTIPMSEESAATWRNPARRRRRMFLAGPYGEQYFDMHVKPGNMTRVHVWTPPIDEAVPITPIYVGHCGKHLD